MATVRHLNRAPITEALFDFKVSLPSDFSASRFAELKAQLSDYPLVDEMRRFEAVFDLKEGKTVPQQEPTALLGYLFKSQDGKTIAQFRRDGFTLNRLAPYTSWEALCPEALRLWSVFVQKAKPERVDRVALRYINRLRIPPTGRLNDHVEVQPPSFPGAPNLLSRFLIRQSRHDPATGYMANIVEALEPGLGADSSVLTIDVDVYKAGGLGTAPTELNPVLDDLRSLKNSIFFGAITEKTAKDYE